MIVSSNSHHECADPAEEKPAAMTLPHNHWYETDTLLHIPNISRKPNQSVKDCFSGDAAMMADDHYAKQSVASCCLYGCVVAIH